MDLSQVLPELEFHKRITQAKRTCPHCGFEVTSQEIDRQQAIRQDQLSEAEQIRQNEAAEEAVRQLQIREREAIDEADHNARREATRRMERDRFRRRAGLPPEDELSREGCRSNDARDVREAAITQSYGHRTYPTKPLLVAVSVVFGSLFLCCVGFIGGKRPVGDEAIVPAQVVVAAPTQTKAAEPNGLNLATVPASPARRTPPESTKRDSTKGARTEPTAPRPETTEPKSTPPEMPALAPELPPKSPTLEPPRPAEKPKPATPTKATPSAPTSGTLVLKLSTAPNDKSAIPWVEIDGERVADRALGSPQLVCLVGTGPRMVLVRVYRDKQIRTLADTTVTIVASKRLVLDVAAE